MIRSTASLLSRKNYDVLIVGGGPIGNSIAYHLGQKFGSDKKIAVIERDLSLQSSSAMLSAGGIRQQFTIPENIKMSIYGTEFLNNISKLQVDDEIPDIQYHQHGYLFLASDDKSSHNLRQNVKLQKSMGADWIDVLEPKELKQNFPWLNTDDLTLGSFSHKNEGYFDPWSYVNALRKKSISLGVEYVEGTVTGAKMNSSGSSSYMLNSLTFRKKSGEHEDISGNIVVNAAGAWSGSVLDTLASAADNPNAIARMPVKRRKRCIFVVHCPNASIPPPNTPLVVDTSGVYFRPESGVGKYIIGVSPEDENDPDSNNDDDLNNIDHSLFNDVIWPNIAHRVQAFEALKVQSSWAGFYDYNTLDQNAIIGWHPELKNLMLCTGFSGHGLMCSPASGRAVTELISSNRYQTIDLQKFSFDRIITNTPFLETGII